MKNLEEETLNFAINIGKFCWKFSVSKNLEIGCSDNKTS